MAEQRIDIKVTATGAAEAAKVLDSIAKSGAQLGGLTVAGAKKAEEALTSLGSTAKTVFSIITGISLAGIFTQALTSARAYAVELEKIGEATLKAERGFQGTTRAVGVDGDALLAKMKEVSRGLADQDDIMLASARALQQGLAPQQLVSLMELATDRAKTMGVTVAEAFNGMSDAIATGNTRALRAAQTILDADKVYKDFADRLNTVPAALNAQLRSQALLEAAMEESQRQAKGVTTALDENVEALERHRIAVNNWKQDQGKVLAAGKAQYVAYFDDLMMRSAKWLERLGEMRNAIARAGPLRFLGPGRGAGASFTDEQPWPIAGDLGGGAKVTPPDATITAFAQVDAAVKLLNASLAAGVTTHAAYRAGLEAQIKTLKALGTSLDADGRLKLLDLQATLLKFDPGPKLEAMFDDFADWNEVLKANEQNMAGWVAVAEAAFADTEAGLKALAELNDKTLEDEQRMLDAAAAGWVAHAEAVIAETEQEQAAIIALNAPLREYQDTMQAIGVEAQLFGDRFDVVGARVSALESRLRDLARTSNGEVKPAMRDLAGQLEEMRQFQDLRDMFQDIFNSVGGAINTLVQGAIQGTQTMAQAFKKLGQSIVIEFVNRVIQQALNPLMKAAAAVVAGLFAPSSKAAAAAFAAGGAGGSDAVAAIGAAGEPSALGTSGFQDTANSLGNFTSALGLATGGTGAFSQVLTGITSGWDAGFGGATGALSGGFDALQAVSAGASTFTVALAGVGAALAVFEHDDYLINGKTEAGIGGIVGGLAGGIAGGIWFGPLGALVGGALGDLVGSFLGGLFGGGPSNYELKRSMAAADANAQVGGITTSFAGAARTGTSAATLAALQSGQAPGGPNPLRTDLALPPALAEQLGLAAKAEIENGRAIVHWADVTQDQFDKPIKLFESDPSMIAGSVRGKGDVSYLGQSDTHALGDQLEQGAVALLTASTAFESVRDKINGLASDIVAAAGEVMPPNMAQELAAHIVNPIRDAMLAVLQDPDLSVEDMQAELDKIGATLEAKVASWEQFAQAMQAAQTIAPSLPDDLPDRMTAALAPVYDAVVSTMRNGTAKQAQAAADNYAKQVALWAAFGEAATHAIDLEAILPTDLGDRFAARMQPQYDKILATLESGNVNLATAQVAAYTKQMAAWASIGQTVSKITSELAANSGDTSSAVETWQAVQGEMDRTVARAKVAFDAAISSGDIERVAKTAATYHDATMARLQAEQAAVQQATAAFDTLLKASAAVQDTLAGLAAADIGSGDATAFTEILHTLADIAMVAPTVQQRLSAISSGFSAIVTALANADVDALLDPLTLFAQMSSAAAPFIGALSDLIETAKNAGDLQGAEALLQQQAAAIKQLEAAAVQAVREWSTAAITAIEKEGAAKSKAIDEQANAEIKLREAAIKNWQAQLAIAQTIEALYTGPNSPLSLTQQVAAAAGAGQAALSRFQAAPSAAGLATVQSAANRFLTIFTSLINDQIALLQKWAAAEDAMGGFLESLYTGPNSPLSLTEQRGLAGDVGQGALSAYTASPTPEGLTALQAAASRYLTISLAQIREKADAEIEAVNAARDARVSALNAEIQAVQDAAAAEQQLIADRIDALQEQVSVTREFEGIVKSVGDLIQSLTTGPMAAGNPADRLTAAKDAFAQSQAAFNANPTAANAADVQSAAQALLPLAESLLSKPSPAYQALFASAIKVLEGVKGVAGAKAGPVSSDDLEAQIKPLQVESKRIAEYAKQTVSGIQMQIEAANARAAETITAINEAAAQEAKDITKGVIDALTAAMALAPQDLAGQKAAKEKELKDTVAAVVAILEDAGQLNGMSSDDLTTMINGAQAQIDWWTHWRETEQQLVTDWKQAQIDAINATADTTIANIQAGVAGALRQNASEQKTITGQLVADTAGILAAVTRGAGSGLIDGVAFLAGGAITTNRTLGEIRDAIRDVTGGATGIERVEEGLYHLHDDEMVVPKGMADQIRSAADGAGLPFEGEPMGMNPRTSTDPRTNDWKSIYNQPRDLSKEGTAWGGPKAAELNALELQMRQIMAQFEGVLAHNVQKKGGRRVQIYSDDELAMMRTALAAQVDAIKGQQRAIIDAIPSTPPPGTPPGTPPTVPPKVPPYTPPGPGWLTRGGTEGDRMLQTEGGVAVVIQAGAIVINGEVKDPERLAKSIVAQVEASVKSGKIGLLVDARVKSLPKK